MHSCWKQSLSEPNLRAFLTVLDLAICAAGTSSVARQLLQLSGSLLRKWQSGTTRHDDQCLFVYLSEKLRFAFLRFRTSIHKFRVQVCYFNNRRDKIGLRFVHPNTPHNALHACTSGTTQCFWAQTIQRRCTACWSRYSRFQRSQRCWSHISCKCAGPF